MARQHCTSQATTRLSLPDYFFLNKQINKLSHFFSARLEAAAEKIEQFNLEEEAYGWDTSQYPLRKTLVNTVGPYLRLYELTVDFNSKHK